MAKVEFTKLSSKGQVVIPQTVRRELGLKEGVPFAVVVQKDTILLKKMELPRIRTWREVTKPFREAARKSGFEEKDLNRLIEEFRSGK